MSTLALFAASGRLPLLLAEEACRQGYKLIAFGVTPMVEVGVRRFADCYFEIGLGQLQRSIDICKAHGVSDIAFAGKIEKKALYGSLDLDDRMRSVFAAAGGFGTDELMRALVAEFESEGFAVISQIDLGSAFLARKGVMTSRSPSNEQMRDIEWGLEALRVMGPLDIGQSVVVKQRVVVAVEGVEGTDQAILRGGSLAGGEAVVVKTPKPGQDLRFDVPTVGERTILSMHSAGCSVLAVQAGSTFILDQDRAVELADRCGICIIGV